MLAFQALVFQRRDVVKAAARLGDQRVGRAVVGIGALDQIVALRKAHDDVAAMRAKRHPNETGRLRKVHVVELLLQLFREQLGELVLETLRPSRSRTANCAGRRIPSAPWDRRVRSTDRCRHCVCARQMPPAGKRCGDRNQRQQQAATSRSTLSSLALPLDQNNRPVIHQIAQLAPWRATGIIFVMASRCLLRRKLA